MKDLLYASILAFLVLTSCGTSEQNEVFRFSDRPMTADDFHASRNVNLSAECPHDSYEIQIYKYLGNSEFYGAQVAFRNGPPPVGSVYSYDFSTDYGVVKSDGTVINEFSTPFMSNLMSRASFKFLKVGVNDGEETVVQVHFERKDGKKLNTTTTIKVQKNEQEGCANPV